MFSRLRRELFFIKRLFSQRQLYQLAAYPNYFKYRFFSGPLLAALPRLTGPADPAVELHLVCRQADRIMLQWSLRSFLRHSGLRPRIVVHDDGTIQPAAAQQLERRFSQLRVLSRAEADRWIAQRADVPEIIKQARRQGHPVLAQLIDVLLLSQGRKIMVMDSDVLFFKRPQEIIDFVNGRSGQTALASRQYGSYDLLMDEAYTKQHDLIKREAGYINPGFIAYDQGSISLAMLADYCRHTRRSPDSFFMPLAGWGCLLAQINFAFLPPEKYIMKGRPDTNTVMKHFTGPRRYEFFAYGITASIYKT